MVLRYLVARLIYFASLKRDDYEAMAIFYKNTDRCIEKQISG